MQARTCDLCGRQAKLTRHHLIPVTRHANKRNKKLFDRREVRERLVLLCSPCHKTVHAVLSEKELEQEYNTLPSLQSHSDILRFVQWVRRQPPGKDIRVRSSNARRE